MSYRVQSGTMCGGVGLLRKKKLAEGEISKAERGSTIQGQVRGVLMGGIVFSCQFWPMKCSLTLKLSR